MAPESWLIKVKAAISNSLQSSATKAKLPKKKSVGILAFEIAGLMSKLLHLSQSISDHSHHHNNSNAAFRLLRSSGESTSLQGIRKLVSADDSFLLALARAEAVEALRTVAKSAARISERCADPNLRDFQRLFEDFANSGEDPHGWAMMNTKKELEENKRMDRYVAATASLYREMTDLYSSEGTLRRSPPSLSSAAALTLKDQQRAFDLQQKISLQKQKIRVLKQKSLWKRSFDTVASMLGRSIFTILARIKRVYGLGHPISPPSLSRSLSASAAVYPSENHNHNPNPNPSAASEFTSGPLAMADLRSKSEAARVGFLESNSKLLKPPASALGASGLAIHYASLIIVMEKMIKSPPQLIGVGARDELYGMLPWSLRSALRERLRGVAVCSAGDARLAGEWRDALDRILGWLSPLAHNMVRWQGERSFERQSLVSGRTGVLMLQTLVFADRAKTEAAITELLVGLNYVWRFEREMTAKALFGCSNFNGFKFPC